jgi:hypothetical protein
MKFKEITGTLNMILIENLMYHLEKKGRINYGE